MEMCDHSSAELSKANEENIQEPQPNATAENPLAEVEAEITDAVEEVQNTSAAAEEAVTYDTLLQRAKELLDKDGADISRDQLTRLRMQFAALHKDEADQADSRQDKEFNDLINQIRDKKNAWANEMEEKRQANLKEKQDIIQQINDLALDTDNVNRTFPLYRELQDKFNAIGEVPPTEETTIWKKFQEAREKYSDNLKINKELRDYDFKKNLDSKMLLIEQATALDAEEDVIVAFRRLQELHDKWRQIGPVAKELREEIWQKFKDASAAINKKYQAFFEERKAREAENEAAKTALCEELDAIDFTTLSTFAAWDETTAKIIDLQARWKAIGLAPRKTNGALFTRFRRRCDEFFTAKGAYFKGVKEEYAKNLARKVALAERAEALKDSTEWRKATDEFVAMQKEWKTIGSVPKKHSDSVWKRFLTACDYFFDKKKAATSGQRNAEQANLKAKREVIAQLEALAKAEQNEEAVEKLRELQDQWQQIGHVPFRDKDKVNDAYRAAVNTLRRSLNVRENLVRMEKFESNIAAIEGDQGKLSRERDRLIRALENRRLEIRTYENNLGFLSSKSKSGQSLVQEFQNKIARLKDDIASIENKISLIDSKMQ